MGYMNFSVHLFIYLLHIQIITNDLLFSIMLSETIFFGKLPPFMIYLFVWDAWGGRDWERGRKREWERVSDIFHLPIPFPNAINIWGCHGTCVEISPDLLHAWQAPSCTQLSSTSSQDLSILLEWEILFWFSSSKNVMVSPSTFGEYCASFCLLLCYLNWPPTPPCVWDFIVFQHIYLYTYCVFK